MYGTTNEVTHDRCCFCFCCCFWRKPADDHAGVRSVFREDDPDPADPSHPASNTPYTLDITPYTLHLTPYTLHLTP